MRRDRRPGEVRPKVRLIADFCVRALVFYGLLVAPWPGAQQSYAAFFRTGGNWLFGAFGREGVVHFVPTSSNPEKVDTDILMKKHGTRVARCQPVSSRYMGRIPTAVPIALILATPLGWGRRVRALAWGLLLANAFVAFTVLLFIVEGYSAAQPYALFALSPFWQSALRQTVDILVRTGSNSAMFTILIWIVVTFRRGDLATLLAGGAGGGEAGHIGSSRPPARADESATRPPGRNRHRSRRRTAR